MNHVALDRAGADDGDFDHQIVKLSRPQARKHRHLRPAFDLEHADGVGVADHVVDAGVFGGDGVEFEGNESCFSPPVVLRAEG